MTWSTLTAGDTITAAKAAEFYAARKERYRTRTNGDPSHNVPVAGDTITAPAYDAEEHSYLYRPGWDYDIGKFCKIATPHAKWADEAEFWADVGIAQPTVPVAGTIAETTFFTNCQLGWNELLWQQYTATGDGRGEGDYYHVALEYDADRATAWSKAHEAAKIATGGWPDPIENEENGMGQYGRVEDPVFPPGVWAGYNYIARRHSSIALGNLTLVPDISNAHFCVFTLEREGGSAPDETFNADVYFRDRNTFGDSYDDYYDFTGGSLATSFNTGDSLPFYKDISTIVGSSITNYLDLQFRDADENLLTLGAGDPYYRFSMVEMDGAAHFHVAINWDFSYV